MAEFGVALLASGSIGNVVAAWNQRLVTVCVGKESTCGAGTTVIEYDCAPEQPLASDTITVKLKVPVAVGVPVIAPSAASVRPGGSAPAVTAKFGAPSAPLCVSRWL